MNKMSTDKYVLFILMFIPLLLTNCETGKPSPFSVVPRPLEAAKKSGRFVIDAGTFLVLRGGDSLERVGNYLQARFAETAGINLKSGKDRRDKVIILRQVNNYQRFGTEGYELKITPESIDISGPPAGVFYGVQSLFQLLPPKIYAGSRVKDTEWSVPCGEIFDKPRFSWRGMHLDVGRHLFPVEFIKKYIDFLAMHKMNRFHWHLTEDQGWRIEIKKYPKLTETGAYRDSTIIGRASVSRVYDGKRYGGYYTQDEVKEVVKYAAERFITVVPEIEMPGHSIAALAAYPHLSCTGGPFQVRTTWGISKDIYCAGNDSVFVFLENVLTEIMDLFPSKYIHIGGDEAPKDRWKECPKCQRRIREEGLKDEHELQKYFITRIERYLNAHGRSIIGWDEILEGGLAPNAAVMSWRGVAGGIEAARQKHPVVMTPTDYCYFDYYQSDPEAEPLAIGGFLPLEKVYSYDPVPKELTTAEKKYILGTQGNVWTEYIVTPENVEYMALPRMSALAETAWSASASRNWEDFTKRLPDQYRRLNYMNTNAFFPPIKGWKKRIVFIDSAIVALEHNFEETEIYYTLDGKDPGRESSRYEKPLVINKNSVLRIREFISGSQAGRESKIKLIKQRPLPGLEPENLESGLKFNYYTTEDKLDSAASVLFLPVKREGVAPVVEIPYDQVAKRFGLSFRGYLLVNKTGVYSFVLHSDDGSLLYIDGEILINNDGLHGPRDKEEMIALEKGYHPIRILYYQAGWAYSLKLSWSGPGFSREEIKPFYYFHQ